MQFKIIISEDHVDVGRWKIIRVKIVDKKQEELRIWMVIWIKNINKKQVELKRGRTRRVKIIN